MQLVPILSTIILVGTLATFILAVFAYILYKVRERRGAEERQEQPVPQPHVLMTPQQAAPALGAPAQPISFNMYAPPQAPQAEPQRLSPPQADYPQPGYAQPEYAQPGYPQPGYPQVPMSTPQPGASNFFYEYTDQGFVPVDPQQPASPPRAPEQQRDDEGFAWL